jgi:hypothetical protein
MEIDIAPQFGAELKVRKTPSVFRASTDTVELPGWIQARQRLGTTPYYFFLWKTRRDSATLPFNLVHVQNR